MGRVLMARHTRHSQFVNHMVVVSAADFICHVTAAGSLYTVVTSRHNMSVAEAAEVYHVRITTCTHFHPHFTKHGIQLSTTGL